MEANYQDQIAIFQTEDGQTRIEVQMGQETVWLSQAQICELYKTSKANVSEHIKHIFAEGELAENAVVRKFRTTARDGKRYNVSFYNLDMIISLGYRVNSRQATQFRIWATGILRDYLIKGYALSQHVRNEHYEELKQLVRAVGRTVNLVEPGVPAEAKGLVQLVADYTYALETLDRYDHDRLSVEETTADEPFHATYENAMEAIEGMKAHYGESRWFANEKDESFKSTMGQLYQTFDGVELYPSVEEKAAMLLYLVVKNHSFSDGNKRIAAALFLWFLHRNGVLYRPDGTKRLGDNALVALTLLIAESRTEEKDAITRVVVSLINRNNP